MLNAESWHTDFWNFVRRGGRGGCLAHKKIMPIPVKTHPKFKCQFCKSYRATLRTVEKHEGFCWQNPDRVCGHCQNTGTGFSIRLSGNLGAYEVEEPCRYCSKENKELTASLKAAA